jgi:hypothetical protein
VFRVFAAVEAQDQSLNAGPTPAIHESFSAPTLSNCILFYGRQLVAISPVHDLLRCGRAAGTSGKAYEGSIASHLGRNVDRPRYGEGVGWNGRVSDGHRQSGAIVGHVHLEDIPAMQIDSAAESGGRHRGYRAVGI